MFDKKVFFFSAALKFHPTFQMLVFFKAFSFLNLEMFFMRLDHFIWKQYFLYSNCITFGINLWNQECLHFFKLDLFRIVILLKTAERNHHILWNKIEVNKCSFKIYWFKLTHSLVTEVAFEQHIKIYSIEMWTGIPRKTEGPWLLFFYYSVVNLVHGDTHFHMIFNTSKRHAKVMSFH